MITTTMNKVEVYDSILNDFRTLDEHTKDTILRRVVDFKKRVRKMPKAAFHKASQLKVRRSMQDYVIILHSRLGAFGEGILAKVRNKNHIWYMQVQPDLTDTMDAFSSHFFNRYAERTHRPALYPTIIGTYFAQNQNMVKIYEDEKTGDSVYASNEGVSLCRWNKKLGITYHCTFVSKNMLKDTQRQAWDIVQDKINEADVNFSKDDSFTERIYSVRKWSASCEEYTKAASEIYSTYFKDMEEDNEERQ